MRLSAVSPFPQELSLCQRRKKKGKRHSEFGQLDLIDCFRLLRGASAKHTFAVLRGIRQGMEGTFSFLS